jgi:ankyrin repeat protein
MIDPQKIFDLLKSNRSDESIQQELIGLLQDPLDIPILRIAGLKNTQSAPAAMFGYGGGNQSEAEVKETSLFAFALAKNKPLSAAILLQALGIEVMLKKNEQGENGFHTVAKCEHAFFKQGFFTESCVAVCGSLSDQLKASINALTNHDQHVLTLIPAAKISHDEVKHWINLGANPHCPGVKSGNLLHRCCELNKPDIVASLLAYDKSFMFERDEKGRLPVHLAAANESIDCLRLLTEAGSPLSIEDNQFNRPLHTAIAKGSVRAIEWILKHQPTVYISNEFLPYVNLPNGAQETPLHLLISYHKKYTYLDAFKEALDILMQYGADSTLKNGKNATAIRHARDLPDDSKLLPSFYDALWSKLIEGLHIHLFTREMLFQRIVSSLPSEQATQLIQTLIPILQHSTTPKDPYSIIQAHYIDSLKQCALTRYPSNSNLTQSFIVMLDEVVAQHQQTVQQRNETGRLLSFGWQSTLQRQDPHSSTHDNRIDSSQSMNI